MIVMNKKRMQIIISCVIIAIFAFSFQVASNTKEENNMTEEEKKTVTTTATPVSGKTIVIDAGHGVPDERC